MFVCICRCGTHYLAAVVGERVPRVLDRIMAVSNGDLRKAITYLQSTHTFYGADLDEAHIVQIAGVIPDTTVQASALWDLCCGLLSMLLMQPTVVFRIIAVKLVSGD